MNEDFERFACYVLCCMHIWHAMAVSLFVDIVLTTTTTKKETSSYNLHMFRNPFGYANVTPQRRMHFQLWIQIHTFNYDDSLTGRMHRRCNFAVIIYSSFIKIFAENFSTWCRCQFQEFHDFIKHILHSPVNYIYDTSLTKLRSTFSLKAKCIPSRYCRLVSIARFIANSNSASGRVFWSCAFFNMSSHSTA